MAQTATNQTCTTTERMNECGFRRGRQPERKPRVIVTDRYVRYVLWEHVDEWRKAGWTINDRHFGGDEHHLERGCTAEWSGPHGHPPPMPVLRRDAEEHQAMPVGSKC